MKGFCLWMTGLSGAGKSTLSRLIQNELKTRRNHIELLDGDVIRTNLSKGLGFSREDRLINLKRIAFVADLLSRNEVAVIVAAITPYQEARDTLRAMVHDYVEIFVNCPLEVCIERDPKGLYKKALAGEITRFTGVDDPFEPPVAPEIEVRTDLVTPEEGFEPDNAILGAAGKIIEQRTLGGDSIAPEAMAGAFTWSCFSFQPFTGEAGQPRGYRRGQTLLRGRGRGSGHCFRGRVRAFGKGLHGRGNRLHRRRGLSFRRPPPGQLWSLQNRPDGRSHRSGELSDPDSGHGQGVPCPGQGHGK